MSVFISVCLAVPFPCYFFSGLLMALRSHDQFKASDWSTIPPTPPQGEGGAFAQKPLGGGGGNSDGEGGGGGTLFFA